MARPFLSGQQENRMCIHDDISMIYSLRKYSSKNMRPTRHRLLPAEGVAWKEVDQHTKSSSRRFTEGVCALRCTLIDAKKKEYETRKKVIHGDDVTFRLSGKVTVM